MEKSLRLLSLVCLLVGSSAIARADDPSVTAVLNRSETVPGQMVQLSIQITGASNPKPPAEIATDGLEIRYGGVSREFEMRNFSVSSRITFNYNVLPKKTGTFKIPPQLVDIGGGKSLRTPELILTVLNAGSTSAPRSAGANPNAPSGGGSNRTVKADPTQIGFVEEILPKTSAYVGEMIPLQVRLGVRTQIDSFGSGIQINGQGFTSQKMRDPRDTTETVNGKTHRIYIFNSAISPARTGKLEIGPAQIDLVARVPRPAGQRNAVPRDLFDDPFFNNFFNDPAFAPSMAAEVHLQSESATLEVKPLPPHAPPQFSSAVGTYTLAVNAAPRKAQVGDPITVTATITGRGNFDRVTVPVLESEEGWHKYPASDNFKQDDDVGISGTKTFEIVLSAKENKTKLPPFIFSFFDPVKETYVTLKSDEIPLTISGGSAPAATPSITAGTTAPVPSATAAPTPKTEQDILYQLTDRPTADASFTPIYLRPAFWLAQLVPLLALLGFIGFKISRARAGDRDAQRLAALQNEAAQVQRRLRRNDVPPQEYVADASRAVQLKTALARKVDPNSVDADSAAAAFQLDDEKRRRLRQLFRESDEMRYSGGRNGGAVISADQKREILELVENLSA